MGKCHQILCALHTNDMKQTIKRANVIIFMWSENDVFEQVVPAIHKLKLGYKLKSHEYKIHYI